MVPLILLLRYFDTAQRTLQSSTDGFGDESLPTDLSTSWHRSRIVAAQLASLDEVVSEWQREGNGSITVEDVQGVLREIGVGDFTGVSFGDSGNDGGQGLQKDHIQEQQLQLAEAVERTNDLAREVFARSILIMEWRLEQSPSQSQTLRQLRGNTESIDEGSILEYCGLMMAAVRLPEVLRYLENGIADFGHPSQDQAGVDTSVDDRLMHIQKLYFRALGWEPAYTMEQLNAILSGKFSESGMFQGNVEAVDTLTKYASVMTVAATNAAMANTSGDGNASNAPTNDGTTRVVSVAYSEKLVSVPASADGGAITSKSLSAPTTNTIDEHEFSQQRQELDVAQKTSMLQQQIWEEFQSLSSGEQSQMAEKAKAAHAAFVVKVANTPPGMERVMLMQSLDVETQKLLILYKLSCGAGTE